MKGLWLLLPIIIGISATAAAIEDPWIIIDDVVVTEPMDVANIILVGNGSLSVLGVPEPGLRITGNLWAVGDSRVRLEDSTIQFMSTYHGQFALAATDNARIEVSGCDYRIPYGVQHGLVSAGQAEIVIDDTDFGDVQLVSAHRARISAHRLNGNFEVIVQNDSIMELADIPRDAGSGRIWVWVEFPEGATAEYSPPLPGFVDTWSFPPSQSHGIEQRITVDRCDAMLWPMLVRAGCDLTLRDISDDNWVVVGFHMPNSATVKNLYNQHTYADTTLGFEDRTVRLVDASIDTWNLYPQEEAVVHIKDSWLGEVLAMGSSRVHIVNTTIDGTGGFFGARDRSVIRVYDSTITSTIEATQEATIELHDSSAEPYEFDPTGDFTRFGAYDSGRLLADQTPVATTPALGGDGLIAVTYLIDPPPHPPTDEVELSGFAAQFSLVGGPTQGAWRCEIRPVGFGPLAVIGAGDGNLEDGEFGTWSTADPRQDHLVRIVLTDRWGRTLVGRSLVPGTGDRARTGENRVGSAH